MTKKLFISNLDFEVTSEQLNELFASVGAVISAVVATDRETKRSKGFAFVEMDSDEVAQKAIDTLNNTALNGRPIKVCVDRGKGGGFGPPGAGGDRERRPEPLPSIQRMQLFRRRKKLDPFMQDPTKSIDYRDTAMLTRFMSERGKILSRRLTGLSAYNQRKVAQAIKRAQNAGLLPFSAV